MIVGWNQPENNGGCPITGYALFRSEPTLYNSITDTETFVEANTDNDQNIRNQPYLFKGTVTNYLANSVGLNFKYLIKAFNVIGNT